MMKRLLLASALTTGLAFPAYAQSDDLSCADFMAMDADAQMKTVSMMAGDDMMSDDMASDDMASDEMASDDMASDDMASDDMASDDMMAEDVTVEEAAAACGEHPEMTVGDAMAASAM